MKNLTAKTITIELTSETIRNRTFELIANINTNNNITYTFKENNKAQNLDLRLSDNSIENLPATADSDIWDTVYQITDVTDLTHFDAGEIEITE